MHYVQFILSPVIYQLFLNNKERFEMEILEITEGEYEFQGKLQEVVQVLAKFPSQTDVVKFQAILELPLKSN